MSYVAPSLKSYWSRTPQQRALDSAAIMGFILGALVVGGAWAGAVTWL